jgi:hypothetical protein
MPFLTIDWVAPYSMGIMPADSSVVLDTPLTVPWTQKQSTYVLPYDPTDLTVKPRPGEPAPQPPVISNPIDVPAPALPGTVGGTPGATPAPAPGPVRPAGAPKVVTLGRITPAAYRVKGIRVKITLTEKARVVVHLEARMRRKTVKRRTVTSVRRLTKQRAVTLKAGTTALRLTPTAGGRRAIGRSSRVRASLLVSARYADGRRTTTRRTVIIAPAKAASKKD